jgi:Group II intron, maturase-specific domain
MRGEWLLPPNDSEEEARKGIKAKVCEIIRHSGSKPMPKVIEQINASLRGWVQYFRVAIRAAVYREGLQGVHSALGHDAFT